MRTLLFLLLLIQFNLESVDFVLFTQPKTGTHLLIPILEELSGKGGYWAPEHKDRLQILTQSFEEASQNPNSLFFSLNTSPWTREMMDNVWSINQKNNSYLHLHAPYTITMEKYLIEKECINFFVKRDPRDQIVSLLNHYKNIHFNDKEVEKIQSDEDRLLYMIRKESRNHTLHFLNWMNSSACCVLDFEKLMGTHGGKATEEDAIHEIRKIVSALKLEFSDAALHKLYQRHFGHGWSFFKGKVGVWKDYFTEEHKIAIKEEIGDLLILHGFEKDLEW